MTLIEWAYVVMGALVIAFNASATRKAAKSPALTRTQRSFHLLFVWVIPIVGAIVVRHLLAEEGLSEPPKLDEQERPDTHPYVTQALEEHVRIAAGAARGAAKAAVVHAIADAVLDRDEPGEPTEPD